MRDKGERGVTWGALMMRRLLGAATTAATNNKHRATFNMFGTTQIEAMFQVDSVSHWIDLCNASRILLTRATNVYSCSSSGTASNGGTCTNTTHTCGAVWHARKER